ncbi:MAG: hypothetical protein IPH58_16585 [Sphingobacteriales bacterium]|nr:hypothetical protein [Sphingobacteriales bacterium]
MNQVMLENGETPKQLLARCKYIFSQKQNDWTENQIQRATCYSNISLN